MKPLKPPEIFKNEDFSPYDCLPMRVVPVANDKFAAWWSEHHEPLATEVKKLTYTLDQCKGDLNEIHRCHRRIKELEEALGFYACAFNWHQSHETTCEEFDCCHQDKGDKARKALEGDVARALGWAVE